MSSDRSTPNRSQYYRNQFKGNFKPKSLHMSRQSFNNWQTQSHYYKRKNWFPSATKAMNRHNKATTIVAKAGAPLNLLRSSLTAPVKQNPDIKRIVEAYQTTMGRGSNQYEMSELIPIQYDSNQSLSRKYFLHIDDVNQFVEKLEFLSTLPPNELEDNMNNWFSALLLRSCWWISFMDEEDVDILRISGNYGIRRQVRLEPLFAFAQTIHEMNLNTIELSLVTTYQLLMGTSTFMPTPEGEKVLTAKRRDYVLKLLHCYQRELYPDDNLRYARLLTALSELSYIAAKLSENYPNGQ